MVLLHFIPLPLYTIDRVCILYIPIVTVTIQLTGATYQKHPQMVGVKCEVTTGDLTLYSPWVKLKPRLLCPLLSRCL